MLFGLGAEAVVGIFIVPAIMFALVYPTITTKLSRGLISGYAKANIRTRIHGATIDGLLVVGGCYLSWRGGSLEMLVATAGYVLLRDAVKGQSIGKLVMGLVVIELETGRPCSLFG